MSYCSDYIYAEKSRGGIYVYMKEYEDNVPTHRLHQKGVGNCCSAFQSVDRSNSICIEISDTILETSPGADAHNYINYTGADICLGCHPQADEDFVTSIPNMWMVTATYVAGKEV